MRQHCGLKVELPRKGSTMTSVYDPGLGAFVLAEQTRSGRMVVHERLDALVYPVESKPARTLAEEVPDGGARPSPPDKRGVGRGNTISPASGLPAIVVPVGFNRDGVGVSLEFLGRSFDEATVIRLAFAYEQADPHRRLPASTPLLGIEQIEYGSGQGALPAGR